MQYIVFVYTYNDTDYKITHTTYIYIYIIYASRRVIRSALGGQRPYRLNERPSLLKFIEQCGTEFSSFSF